jgi:hypothetical protein
VVVRPCVTILMVSRVVDVKIRKFWTKKWTNILSLSFSIAQIPLLEKKIKTGRTKNKNFKLQGQKDI